MASARILLLLLVAIPGFARADAVADSVAVARPNIVRKTSVFKESPLSRDVCLSLVTDARACVDVPLVVLETTYFRRQPFVAKGADAGAFVKPQPENTQRGRDTNRFVRLAFGALPVILIPERIAEDPAWKDVVIAHEMGQYLFTYKAASIAARPKPGRRPAMNDLFVRTQMKAEFDECTALSRVCESPQALLNSLKPLIATYGVQRQEFAVTAEIVAYRRLHPEDDFNDFLCFRFGQSTTRKALLKNPDVHLKGCWDGTPKVITEYFRVMWNRTQDTVAKS